MKIPKKYFHAYLIKKGIERPFLNKNHFKGVKGVYFICRDNIIVYIGMSGSNVVKTLYRHFNKWNDHQYRVSFEYNKTEYKCKIIKTEFPEILEKQLIIKYKPELNKIKYENYEKESEKNGINESEDIICPF